MLFVSAPANSTNRSHRARATFVAAQASPKTERKNTPKAHRDFSRLPLSFEPNVGQTDSQVRFLAHGNRYTLFLTNQAAAVLTLKEVSIPDFSSSPRSYHTHEVAHSGSRATFRMQMKGANRNPQVVAVNQLPGKISYFIGNDPTKWQTGIPSYARVQYKAVYPGIDAEFYGNQMHFECDFVVHPGGDVRQIALTFGKGQKTNIDANGDILVTMGDQSLVLRKPISYQEEGGVRHDIPGSFVMSNDSTAQFVIEDYDRTKALVIDPVVDYATYLGGTVRGDYGDGLALDSNGNAYITGITGQTDFPVTANGVETSYPADNTSDTVFVTEINAAGTAVLYSTYLGGNRREGGAAIAVDSATPPNVYVTGSTCSTNFPTTSNAYQQNQSLSSCPLSVGVPFVTEINPSLSGTNALIYSTYLGGNEEGSGDGIALGPAGDIYVAGHTQATDFPTTIGAFQTTNKAAGVGWGRSGFISRIDATKSGAASLVASTYLGGSGNPQKIGDASGPIAVDEQGHVYVGGVTCSTDFPTTANAFMQTAPAGVNSTGAQGTGFFSEFDSSLSATSLLYSTYVGGSSGEGVYGLSLGPGTEIYLAGETFSSDFPVTTGAFRTTPPSSIAAYGTGFTTVMDPSHPGGNSLIYSTFFGGSDDNANVAQIGDFALSIAADSSGNAYVTGFTASTDFPTTPGAFQTTMAGFCSTFVSELMPGGNGAADLVYSTYFDGTESSTSCANDDVIGFEIRTDSAGNAYVTGGTASSDFPVTSSAYETQFNGDLEAYVGELSMTPKVLPTPSLTSLSVNNGIAGASVTLTGTNFGVSQATSTVQFGSAIAPIVSWNSTSIVAQVPADADPDTVNVLVTTPVGSSNTQSFTVLPSVASLSPSSGPVGAAVTIYGSNFGTAQGFVLFNGTSATITSWDRYTIVTSVPAGATTGNLTVQAGLQRVNGGQFTVVATPSISGLSQNSGIAGNAITISGSNFGASQAAESGAVIFNGAAAAVSTWSDTSIVALVPGTGSPGAGTISVTAGGVQSNSFVFTIDPTISVISPSSARECQVVTISGSNFGATQGTGTVQIADENATVTSWSSTSISATVPTLFQGTFPLTVTAGSVSSSYVVFTDTGNCQAASTANPPTPGMPPFASVSSAGPDKIDLGNLNVHYDIPVFSKPGRETPFNYTLKYDSSVWAVVGGSQGASWQPVTNWGWGGQSSVIFGNITYAVAVQDTCSADGLPYTTYSGWSYQDSFGVTHPFSMWSISNDTNCNTNTQFATVMDGTGYSMTVTAVPNTNPQQFTATVSSKSGQQFSPPVSSATTTATYTDRNGNQITENNGVFTDTLGTTALTVSGTAPNPVKFGYTPPAGGTVYVQVTYKNYSIQTAFGCSGITEYSNPSVPLVDRVTYPDGTFYQFAYELTPGSQTTYTGRVVSVTLPTGGTISYSYQGGSHGINCADGSTAGFERFTPDTGSAFWNYAKSYGSGSASSTTITDPQGNQSVMDFQGLYPTESDVYNGTSSSGKLLQTTFTCYNGNTADCNDTAVSPPIFEKSVTTQLPGSPTLAAKHVYMYDSNQDLTEQQDFGYGIGSPGGPLRIKSISYATINNNINSMPSSISVVNSSGDILSDTVYNYDESLPDPTTGTPQHVAVDGDWGRGNLTSMQMYTTGSTYLRKSFRYFDTGNVETATDVNGAQTTYTYGACGNSFPTAVSEPLGLSRSITWNCTGGVETSVVDENSQTSSVNYTDPYFWRPNSATDQMLNVTSYSYTPTSTDQSMLFNGGASITDQLGNVDSLGRTHVSQAIEGPGAGAYDSVETDYDSDGRPTRTTLPYTTSSAGGQNPSAPGTTTFYDALGRKAQVTNSGGLDVTFDYNQNDALKTAGPRPTGENTKKKQYEYDALGRLTSVCEVTQAAGSGSCGQTNAQNGYWTKYFYDATGNLTSVIQNAQASSDNQQTRAYTYDKLGRLTAETNPESGFTVYSYDTDSTCGTSYGDLVKKADAMGNVTCYTYDALHRMTSTTYPTGSYALATPSRYFVYDAATVNGVAMSNTKTHLAEAYTCSTGCPSTKITDEGFSYDTRGEATDFYESTPDSGGYYHVAEAYWADGNLRQLSGISGLPTVTYGVDSKGRQNAVSASSGQNPVTSVTYSIANRITGITFGSSDSDSFTYNPNTGRMTEYTFNVGGASMTGALTWNAVGTLHGLTITDPFYAGGNQTCSYLHDDLIRVAAVDCGSVWSQTFSYDAFGNINKNGSSSFSASYSPTTNQMIEIGGSTPTYDSDGNVTNDFLHTYSWDSNDRPVTIDGVGLTYDAFGHMVEQDRGGSYTQIVYGPHGRKFALMNASVVQKAYVPIPDGAMAIYSSSGLSYYRHTDWIASSRLASTPNQTVYFDGAYAPFGEPYATNGTSDLSFTGMDQDTVLNLYDFPSREYGIQGRWPSPDPAGVASMHLKDPQTLNRYAYARNNPLALTDPNGTDDCDWGENYGDCVTSFCPNCDFVYDGGGGGYGGETGTTEDTNPGGDIQPPDIPNTDQNIDLCSLIDCSVSPASPVEVYDPEDPGVPMVEVPQPSQPVEQPADCPSGCGTNINLVEPADTAEDPTLDFIANDAQSLQNGIFETYGMSVLFGSVGPPAVGGCVENPKGCVAAIVAGAQLFNFFSSETGSCGSNQQPCATAAPQPQTPDTGHNPDEKPGYEEPPEDSAPSSGAP